MQQDGPRLLRNKRRWPEVRNRKAKHGSGLYVDVGFVVVIVALRYKHGGGSSNGEKLIYKCVLSGGGGYARTLIRSAEKFDPAIAVFPSCGR
jgi:hypothetical protein